MPGFTPNFAIQYPCAGETIDSTVFQTFADDVEAALTTVGARVTAAVDRPSAAVVFNGTSVPVGVNTQLDMSSADFQNNISIPGTDSFVIIEAGLYLVTLEAGSTTVTTSMTSWAAEIRQNATTRYRRKVSPSPAVTSRAALNLCGLVQCAAADSIDFTWQWTGAGINLVVPARATICKISEP